MQELREKKHKKRQFFWLKIFIIVFFLLYLNLTFSILAHDSGELSGNFKVNAQEEFQKNSSEIYRLHRKIFSGDQNSWEGDFYTDLIAKIGIENLFQILTALEGFIEVRPINSTAKIHNFPNIFQFKYFLQYFL